MEMSPAVAMLLSFGLAGVGCLAAAEKFIPVFPSYVLLMFIGMAVPDGGMLALTIMATVIGSVIGSLGWYGVGRALGSQRVETMVAGYGRYVFLSLSLYRRLTNSYRRNQFWATLIGHTIPTVRVYLGLPAGVLRLDPRVFLAATALGSLAWNAPFASLGYCLRDSGHDPVSLGLGVAAVLVASEFAILWAVRFAMRFFADARRHDHTSTAACRGQADG